MSARVSRLKPIEDAPAEYVVQTGISLPASRGGHPFGDNKYPWSRMQVGDSFFARGGRDVQKKISGAGISWGRRHGCKFATRGVTENGVNGFRVWRTA